MNQPMLRSDYAFHLPGELIAQHPLDRRDDSRLLCLDRRDGALSHRRFRELPGLLRPGDVLVMNDSRVLPSRLLGRREGTGGAAELLLRVNIHFDATARDALNLLLNSLAGLMDRGSTAGIVSQLDCHFGVLILFSRACASRGGIRRGGRLWFASTGREGKEHTCQQCQRNKPFHNISPFLNFVVYV